MPRSIARARSDFFTRAGFASDGGYQDLVAEAEFAGLPYQVHNGSMRREALRIHDLHHLVTGFATDWKGEAEISAWELGSGGGGRHLYAWNIALWGLFTGLLAIPTRTWRAFQQGRMRSNLYVADVDVDALLPEPEQALQALTQGRANWLPDAGLFGLLSVTALVWGAMAMMVVPLFAFRSALARACSCPLACGSMALG